MKNLFFLSFLTTLCFIATLSVAQSQSDSVKLKTGLKHVNEDLRLITSLTTALAKDDLINKTTSYNLKIKDGEFYIDFKKQPEEITNKYRKYFRKDRNVNYSIISDGNGRISTVNNDNIIINNPKKRVLQPDTVIRFSMDGVPYDKYITSMNQFLDSLHKDGLIDKRKAYKVEIKAAELYINGKRQPKEISDKFRKYFQSDNYALMND